MKWSERTMEMINNLTPDIKGKAFDPDWFLLRERLEQMDALVEVALQVAKLEQFERAKRQMQASASRHADTDVSYKKVLDRNSK